MNSKQLAQMEKDWKVFREGLEQLFATAESVWNRLKFNYTQGYSTGFRKGYVQGYEDRRDGWDADYPQFQPEQEADGDK